MTAISARCVQDNGMKSTCAQTAWISYTVMTRGGFRVELRVPA
jgi:hypothetical protein